MRFRASPWRRSSWMIAAALCIGFLVLAGGCSQNDDRYLRIARINGGAPLYSDIIDHGEMELDEDDFDNDADVTEAYGWDDSVSDDLVMVDLTYSPGSAMEMYSAAAARVTHFRVHYTPVDGVSEVPDDIEGALSFEVSAEEGEYSVSVIGVETEAKLEEPLTLIAALMDLGGHSYYAGTGTPLPVIAELELTGEDVASGAELKATGSFHISFADWAD
jgi:hypothetical protein